VSAFTVDPAAQHFLWSDGDFTVPEVDGLVVYELHVGEFAGSFDAAVDSRFEG